MNLTDTERKNLAARGLSDPAWFFTFFFEEWFPGRMPWVHKGLIAILTRRCQFLLTLPLEEIEKICTNFVWEDDQGRTFPIFITNGEWDQGRLVSRPTEIKMVLGKFTLVLMPRGFSKTTILNAATIWAIVYQIRKFPLYVSKTGKHAQKQLSTIANQLASNPKLQAVFGGLKPVQRDGGKWSESDGLIQTTTGISVGAVGRGGQVRGMVLDAQRPDQLNIDDLEDQESTKTDSRREDTRDWFFSDLLPVLPELDPTAGAVMLGNLVNQDCLITRVMQDPNWTSIKFGALDRQGDPLWPENMDRKKLEKKKKSYALVGKLHRFYMEYMNEIRAPENALWQPGFFIIQPRHPRELVRKAIAVDPAISENQDADFAVITVGGMTSSGQVHICDQYGRIGMSPRELVDKYFEMARRWGLTPHDRFGIESVAYQAALVHLMREEMFRKKFYFQITPQTHTMRKEERIEFILQPRYANGYVTHQRPFSELETSLLDWPNGKKDWADSAAMMVELLDPAAPFALDGDLDEKELPDLEEVFEGDWRTY